MAATTRQHDYRSVHPGGRYRGLVIVVALHLLVVWLLVTGTARRGLELLQKPPDAAVIQQVFIPPPPVPVPPPKETRPLEEKAVAPAVVAPARVPPPVVAAPEGPTLAITDTPAPAAPVIAAQVPAPLGPSTGPAPAPATATQTAAATATAGATPAAPAAPAAPAKAAARTDIGVACPTQVKPVPPPRALKDGVSGVVRAQALIRDGVVREVTILSGPRVFHNAVREAMLQYTCVSDPGDHLVPQDFVFKID